jgi:hypothetical protein
MYVFPTAFETMITFLPLLYLVVPHHKYLHVFAEPAFDHKDDYLIFYVNLLIIEQFSKKEIWQAPVGSSLHFSKEGMF